MTQTNKGFPPGYPKDERSPCPRCRSTMRRKDDQSWVTCLSCWVREHQPSGEIVEPGIQ